MLKKYLKFGKHEIFILKNGFKMLFSGKKNRTEITAGKRNKQKVKIHYQVSKKRN
jgi:hypothetical protein